MTDTTLSDLRAALNTAFTDGEIEVALDGDRARISVVSEAFAGLSRVKQQQAVYAAIGQFVSDGRLHAVTIDTRTKDA
ncbi:MAG: BolA/IbaG family iron-sulfur metabolism protein [Pseudomonadales bacterium]